MGVKRALRILLVLMFIAAASYGAWWVWRMYPDELARVLDQVGLLPNTAEISGLIASGSIEADRIRITSEAAGRIVELLVDEGDVVEQEQVVLRLDSSLLEAQIAQAQAALEVTQANLALVTARASPEELRLAQAAVRQAESVREAASQAWLDAQMLRDTPQDLDLQILASRTEVEVAKHQLAATRAEAQAADLELELWGRTLQLLERGEDVSVPIPDGGTINVHVDASSDKVGAANLQWNLASQSAWQAHEAEREAEEVLRSAREALSHLQEQRDNPQQLQAEVDTAEAAVQVAIAGLLAVRKGATVEQVRLAEAETQHTQAALGALFNQRDKFFLRSPRKGTVVVCPVHVGELALPGSTLLEIADLDQVTLTAYVPENRLGDVRIGQLVRVRVDSFPERPFEGMVTRIADEAESTPSGVAMQEERILVVVAVEITLANPQHVLKPGMPADADFLWMQAAS